MNKIIEGQRWQYKSHDGAYDYIIEIQNIITKEPNFLLGKVIQIIHLSGRALSKDNIIGYIKYRFTIKELLTGINELGKYTLLKNQSAAAAPDRHADY